MKKKQSIFVLLILLQLLIANRVIANETSYSQINLPQNISISIPSNWIQLSEDMKKQITEFAKNAVGGNPEIHFDNNKKTLLAVNSAPEPHAAMIRVSLTMGQGQEFTQEDMKKITPEDLKYMTREFERITRNVGVFKLIKMQNICVENIHNCEALVIPYIRASAVDGSHWQVRQYKISAYGKYIEMTLSHKLSQSKTMEPILKKVKESLRF